MKMTLKLWALAILIQSLFTVQLLAQDAPGSDSGTSQPDSIVQITAEAEGLTRVDPSTLPVFASCWWTVFTNSTQPLPMPIAPTDLTVPIYEITDGIYLVDQSGGAVNVSPSQMNNSEAIAAAVNREGNAIADLIEQVQEAESERSMAMAFGMDLPVPGGSGDGTNSYTPDGSGFTMPDYGTNLWIAQTAVASGWLTGIGSNTIADVQYEIQSRTNLLQTDWQSEGFITGSEITNWTSLAVQQNGRTNLFIRLRSWIDSDNVGIPDWWQLEYFGYVGINPYGNPTGDGYDNLYKFANGLNPTNFISPPGPSYFVAVLSTNGTDVKLVWNHAQGAVTNYTIVRYSYNPATYSYDATTVGTVSATQSSLVDAGAVQTPDELQSDYYTLTADYPSGDTSDTDFTGISTDQTLLDEPSSTAVYNISVSAKLIRNSNCRWQLMFSALPSNVHTIRVVWTDANGNSTTQSLSTNSIVNGVYQISDTDSVNLLGETVTVQGVGVNGEPGEVLPAGRLSDDAPYFVDGRRHLKQNLSFLIRGAGATLPYEGEANVGGLLAGNYVQAATNFEESSFLHHGSWGYTIQNGQWTGGYLVDNTYSVLDNLWPFNANYELENFFLNTSTYTNLYPSYDGFNTPQFQFQFVPNFNTNIPAPAILNNAAPYWIIQPQFSTDTNYFDPEDFGLGYSAEMVYTNVYNNASVTLVNATYNLFGLPYQNGCLIKRQYSTINFTTLGVGSTASLSAAELTNSWFWETYASQCPAPTLTFSNYYFAPLINPKLDNFNLPGSSPYAYYFGANYVQYPTPIDDTFIATNQTPPVIIGAVGQPMVIGSWTKYGIQGSSPAKYAYLGQYFMTNAFLLDTNGNATTNIAGILSPYGEFFPTQTGQTRLTTMPDVDSGIQGTCTVSVISLNVDANHDGAMDLSYFGKDQTSSTHPYLFWCNNNFDRVHTVDGSDVEQDDLQSDGSPYARDVTTPDYNYVDANGSRQIPCIRDLEDFSRLWIGGMTSNSLASLPAGSTVTLNWGDVGSPNPNNPTIDIFQAADSDGGIGYLTNSTVAAQQTNNAQCWFINRLAPGGSIQLNSYVFNNFWAGNHFIWCGVSNGMGGLTLTVADANSNVLGQATVYIQIMDIKQMYERWTVGENGNTPPQTTAVNAEDDGHGGYESPFSYGPATTDTPYILFVHGWNMQPWEKDRFAESAYKRLFWQGYQGRFGVFRWPTFNSFPLGEFSSQAVNPRNYDNSEYNAWLSATGLLNKLSDLNTEYPGHVYLIAHSMGNVVAGEALRMAGSSQVVNTYIAMQAALSAHEYDPNTPTLGYTPSTPDNYAQYWTNGASCYFNASAGAGRYVNFYNTNDFALTSTFGWTFDQEHKPDHGVAGFSIPYPGYYYLVSSQHPNGYYAQLGAGTNAYQNFNFPGDTYTIFSYCDQSESSALGAEANVSGAFNGHVLDLQSIWPADTHSVGSYKEHVWHSAEFRSDAVNRWGFWREILGDQGLKLK